MYHVNIVVQTLSSNKLREWQNKNILTIYLFSTNHLETHAICSIINKIYSNKQMAPNNKWKFVTPLKNFYTGSYPLVPGSIPGWLSTFIGRCLLITLAVHARINTNVQNNTVPTMCTPYDENRLNHVSEIRLRLLDGLSSVTDVTGRAQVTFDV